MTTKLLKIDLIFKTSLEYLIKKVPSLQTGDAKKNKNIHSNLILFVMKIKETVP